MSDPMRAQYRELTAVEKRQVDELKVQARHLYGFLLGLGEGREFSIAKTKLEEAVMWATKGLTG